MLALESGDCPNFVAGVVSFGSEVWGVSRSTDDAEKSNADGYSFWNFSFIDSAVRETHA